MPRIPYEIVAIQADRIIFQMVVAPTMRQTIYYWDLYIDFITACGWTDREFDTETLRRVDAAWESLKRQWSN